MPVLFGDMNLLSRIIRTYNSFQRKVLFCFVSYQEYLLSFYFIFFIRIGEIQEKGLLGRRMSKINRSAMLVNYIEGPQLFSSIYISRFWPRSFKHAEQVLIVK